MRVSLLFIPITLLVPVAALAIIYTNTPSFDDTMQSCMHSERNNPPAERTATCLCLVEEVRAVGWAAYKFMVPASQYEIAERAAKNTCRAIAYSTTARPQA